MCVTLGMFRDDHQITEKRIGFSEGFGLNAPSYICCVENHIDLDAVFVSAQREHVFEIQM